MSSPAREARRARERARRRRRVALVAFGLGLSTGLLLGRVGVLPVAGMLAPESLELREVRVLGHQRLAAVQVARAAGLVAETGLLGLDPLALAESIASHPWVRSARVRALPPGRVMVAVEERQAVATTPLADGALWWVDLEGVPFAPVEDGDAEALPRIVGAEGVAPQQAHSTLVEGVAVARALAVHGLPRAREIELGGSDPDAPPCLRLDALSARVLLGIGDRDAKLRRLARLLEAELPAVATASSIDLRFGDRTVLRSGPSPTGGGAEDPRRDAGPLGSGPTG